MASVERIYGDNGRLIGARARWRDPNGASRKKVFPRVKDAERWIATVESSKAEHRYVDLSDKTTVSEYAEQWLASRPHRASTAQRQKVLISKHVTATKLGKRRLVAVTPSEVQTWATDRAQVLAPSTMQLLVSVLRSIYASAVLDRLVGTTPVVRIKLPSNERPRVIPLTTAQVVKLASKMPPRNRAMVITQAGLGLRIAELLALRVQDVDFLHRSVRIERQITPVTRTFTDPKTPRSKRTLPLPTVVAEALAAHIAEFPPGTDGALFTTNSGALYRADHYGHAIFKIALEKAGLPKSTSSHDLRHHYASVLLAAGESVVAVAERLGHTNANLVLSTYGHLLPDSEDRTRRAVDDAFRALTVPSDAAASL